MLVVAAQHELAVGLLRAEARIQPVAAVGKVMPRPAKLNPSAGVGAESGQHAVGIGRALVEVVAQVHGVGIGVAPLLDDHLVEISRFHQHFALAIDLGTCVGRAGLHHGQRAHPVGVETAVAVVDLADGIARAGVVIDVQRGLATIGVDPDHAAGKARLEETVRFGDRLELGQRFVPGAMAQYRTDRQRPVVQPLLESFEFTGRVADGDACFGYAHRLAGLDLYLRPPRLILVIGFDQPHRDVCRVVSERLQRAAHLVARLARHLAKPPDRDLFQILGLLERQRYLHVRAQFAADAGNFGHHGLCSQRACQKHEHAGAQEFEK